MTTQEAIQITERVIEEEKATVSALKKILREAEKAERDLERAQGMLKTYRRLLRDLKNKEKQNETL